MGITSLLGGAGWQTSLGWSFQALVSKHLRVVVPDAGRDDVVTRRRSANIFRVVATGAGRPGRSTVRGEGGEHNDREVASRGH